MKPMGYYPAAGLFGTAIVFIGIGLVDHSGKQIAVALGCVVVATILTFRLDRLSSFRSHARRSKTSGTGGWGGARVKFVPGGRSR